MTELGSGSGSSYPGSLDSDSTLEVDSPAAGKTKARANVPNDLAAAIIAIQTELGTDPAGSAATVKARLAVEHNDAGTHSIVTTSSGIIAGGHVIWATDSTYDIGVSGIRRPRDLYVARDLTVDGAIDQRGGIRSHLFFASNNTYDIGDLAGNGRPKDLFLAGKGMLVGGIDAGNSGTFLKTKVIDIGDWNMDATTQVLVAHGLTLANIRRISVTIRDDVPNNFYDFPAASNTATSAEFIAITATNVDLNRAVSGFFDTTAFDSTSYNRGWITIDYV